jgi:tetratricopeptide (TPR) repeat protein/CHAT domain-containing protein
MPGRRLATFALLLALIGWLSGPAAAQDLEKATALNQQVQQLYAEGRYQEALPLAEEVLTLFEKNLEPDHPHISAALNNLAALHDALGQYELAEPFMLKALAIDEKLFGPQHPEVASALNNLAAHYYYQGKYQQAIPLYRRALAIRETALGPEHLDVANSLNNLAALLDAQGQYKEAEKLYEQALTIREKGLGPDHPAVATVLNNLAGLKDALGDYAGAEPLYQRALSIQEKTLGPDHPQTASTINNLALLYDTMGEFSRAERMYNQALEMRLRTLGPDHPDLAVSYNNLATLYQALGDLDRALPMLERALEIREKTYGPDHPEVAQSLNNLALLHDALGDYQQAEPLYKKALATWEKTLGPNHPELASSLNNLAEFYKSLGDYPKALPYYEKALEIRKTALGPEHPDVAVSLNNLAGLRDAQKDYRQAGESYAQALAIWEKALGPQHPNVATAMDNLAGTCAALDDRTRAEKLYRQALDIREKALGPEHPDTAAGLNNLAGLYFASGDLARSQTLHEQALAILEKKLGPEHPLLSRSLDNLAVVCAAREDWAQARGLLKRSQDLDRRTIDQVLGFTSEDRKIAFLAQKKYNLYAFLSLTALHLADDSQARRDAFEAWINRKGIILEAQKQFQAALVDPDNQEARQIFEELTRVRTQLSKQVFPGGPPEDTEQSRNRQLLMEQRRDELEARLSRLSRAYAQDRELHRADARKIAAALPPDSALLEFARTDIYDFQAKSPGSRWQPARYLVFIIRPGAEGEVGLKDLGPAEVIDQQLFILKKLVTASGDEGIDAENKAASRLYDLVFAPLEKSLGPARDIFIAPDGNLNLIPFEILISPRGRYLIDDYQFNYLTSGRDLLARTVSSPGTGRAMILGDPDFDLALGKPQAPAPHTNQARDLRGMKFTPLPGTREEAQAVSSLLGSESPILLTGDLAREEYLFARKEPPRLLHLATHGFFLSDLQLAGLAGNRANLRDLVYAPPSDQPTKTPATNPLLRSGLALAGANRILQMEEPEFATGLLTAEKVLGMKLAGTELVVLSACQTGLGEVHNGEGVYGLRRTFIQAGVQSLVMSLWSVPDLETKELMVAFYSNMKSGKWSRSQSLRQATLSQKDTVARRYGHTRPLFWGAFVFLGLP